MTLSREKYCSFHKYCAHLKFINTSEQHSVTNTEVSIAMQIELLFALKQEAFSPAEITKFNMPYTRCQIYLQSNIKSYKSSHLKQSS
jgi:hypothetical protein